MSKRRNATTANNAKGPKFSRLDEQDLSDSQTLFTVDEKRNFLKACQENGLSVIYDLKKLGEYLPARSETEIRSLIQHFERKSRYRKENADFEQTPLETWYSLCDQLIRSPMKREDSSMLLIDLMSRYSAESVKYASIYSYLKELMEGKYTSKLTAYDSIVFLCLIDTLSSFIKSQDLTSVKNYILRLYQQLNEQLANGKRSRDEVGTEYLNYFEQIDPTKLKADIELASAQLNRRRLDQQVAADPPANRDEQQLAGPQQASPPQSAVEVANSATNQRNHHSHPAVQDTSKQKSVQAGEQTQNRSTTCNKTPSNPVISATDSSQASAVSSVISSFVSAINGDDDSVRSNLNNQQLFNKQEQITNLISESSVRPNQSQSDCHPNIPSNSRSNCTRQPAIDRLDEELLKSQNPLHQYSQLPRITKMRECLNPLGISIEVLKELHALLAAKRV